MSNARADTDKARAAAALNSINNNPMINLSSANASAANSTSPGFFAQSAPKTDSDENAHPNESRLAECAQEFDKMSANLFKHADATSKIEAMVNKNDSPAAIVADVKKTVESVPEPVTHDSFSIGLVDLIEAAVAVKVESLSMENIVAKRALQAVLKKLTDVEEKFTDSQEELKEKLTAIQVTLSARAALKFVKIQLALMLCTKYNLEEETRLARVLDLWPADRDQEHRRIYRNFLHAAGRASNALSAVAHPKELAYVEMWDSLKQAGLNVGDANFVKKKLNALRLPNTLTDDQAKQLRQTK
jgi:hypothetical protein